MTITVGCAVAALVARNSVRGQHDNATGLGMVPSAGRGAPPRAPDPTAGTTSTSTDPPVLTSPPETSSTSTSSIPVTASASAASSARPRPRASASAASSSAPSAPAPASGESAASLTAAAQRALEKPGGTGRARDLALEATRRDPSNAEAWLTLGAAHDAVGNKRAAMAAYQACVRSAPAHPRAGECRALAGE
jgi:hypothetical protein